MANTKSTLAARNDRYKQNETRIAADDSGRELAYQLSYEVGIIYLTALD